MSEACENTKLGRSMSPDSYPVESLTQEGNETQESTEESSYDMAARVIQRTWRKHTDIAVFKYIKSLVSFHNQGDPRLLLKYVNPREAELLDNASGVFIRFRLGGTTFPPSIYYKIFTHCPIVDLCASSPKDYTHIGLKQPVLHHEHNNQSLPRDDRSGWYRRVENNGWRLLSGKVCLFEDPITQDTNNKRTQFHHCKFQRRQDAERKKKKRKIEWMKKMYEEGALQACSDPSPVVQSSSQDMMSSAEQMEDSIIIDCEVDKLIEWTNTLDFDKYLNEWNHLGTSSSSVFSKDKQVFLFKHVPCEFSQLPQDRRQEALYSTERHLSSLIKLEYLKK